MDEKLPPAPVVEPIPTKGYRVFVRSQLSKTVKEIKPGLGEYIIPAHGEVEIFDVYGEVETPLKTKVPYLRYSAKTIASSLVQDFGTEGLEVVIKEV